MYYSFALAGHRGTCLRPLHIFALLCFALSHVRWPETTSAWYTTIEDCTLLEDEDEQILTFNWFTYFVAVNYT